MCVYVCSVLLSLFIIIIAIIIILLTATPPPLLPLLPLQELLLESIGRANGVDTLRNDITQLIEKIDVLRDISSPHIHRSSGVQVGGVEWYKHYFEPPTPEPEPEPEDPLLAFG